MNKQEENDVKCYNCGKTISTPGEFILTWFYDGNSLKKDVLCKTCLEKDCTSIKSREDMYTADEVVKILRSLISHQIKKKNLGPEIASEIGSDAIEELKPTLEKDVIELHE